MAEGESAVVRQPKRLVADQHLGAVGHSDTRAVGALVGQEAALGANFDECVQARCKRVAQHDVATRVLCLNNSENSLLSATNE